MSALAVWYWLLGTEFKGVYGKVERSQRRYIEKLLAKLGMADCKPKATPTILGRDKAVDESPELKTPSLYRAMVGSLIYVMTGTRPDLCYAVTKLSQKMSKPTEADLVDAKHVFRYLKGTTQYSLAYSKSETELKLTWFCAYIDIKYHYIRSEVQPGSIKLVYIPTDENVADVFTKSISSVKLEKFRPFISS